MTTPTFPEQLLQPELTALAAFIRARVAELPENPHGRLEQHVAGSWEARERTVAEALVGGIPQRMACWRALNEVARIWFEHPEHPDSARLEDLRARDPEAARREVDDVRQWVSHQRDHIDTAGGESGPLLSA
ncbi:hypothetical protein [Streptomyces sp. NPDC007856]|uniref:hypothetical protein n=1 Tax=Streptomyces sp. NPDC007856 TaxID=3364781 RepID=UPI0036B0AF41